MNQEQYVKFHQVLILMSHSARSQSWLVRHHILQQTLNEMVEFEYLIEYEKDNEIYYKTTEKSHKIW